MDDQPILVEDRAVGAKARYRVISLNRPHRLNAFVAATHHALKAALIEAERDEACRAVLITGAGRGFCAGQDLSERRMNETDPPLDLGATIDALYNPLIRRLRALPMPVVCAVNGPAPDAGVSFFLTHLVGPARARGLAMLAEPLAAEKAEAWGLIWKAVDNDKLMGEAHALCERLATGSPAALAAIKQSLEAAATNGLDRQLDLERDLQRQLGRAGDYREGVRAFFEKRPA